jgi:TolA-binding protein
MMFGQPNNDIMHQILARFDRMETAFAASQNTSANRITQLEKQVAQLTAEIRKLRPQPTNPHANKSTKANPERGHSAAPPAPTPAIPLHAPVPNEWNALWNGSHNQTLADHLNRIAERTQDEKPFTTVERKKKKTPTTVIPKALPRADREVIITLGENVTDHATTAD